MATHGKNIDRKDRNGQWVLSKDIPTDILVQVGAAEFPLHKFMLLAKSNHIRRLVIESEEPDLRRINLSNIPGGAEIFEKAAKFCYGMDVEITVNNVAALHCAAEYLEMTDQYCDGNLASRTYAFLTQVALTSLSGAITVLRSCQQLLPIAEQLNIVHQCIQVASAEACNEANSPSCSPSNWWAEELSMVHITFFQRIIDLMKSRGTKALAIAGAITTYAKRSFPNHSVNGIKSPVSGDSSRIKQRDLLESIVALFPVESQQAVFSINFLCYLLRTAIMLENNDNCKKQLEKRISAILDQVTVDDLLLLSYTFDGERLCDMESISRIVTGFVGKEKNLSVFNYGDYKEAPSPAMIRVAKTIDVYLSKIAMATELSIPKFTGIANLVPKNARDVDDDLYHAIDIYLQLHPNLDEIEREKVCNPVDPLKLSVEARTHASQNKRLPLQIVLHTLYYDELQARSDIDGRNTPGAQSMRLQVHADAALAKENETLRSELLRMKTYISNIEKKQVGVPSPKLKKLKKPTFFSTMSKTLGKLNPFKLGSKDTSNISDEVDHNKPRRRRFSMS
ncbi:BTB/POZ-like protein [Cynara cardunculus var. scolymus]|uniref:BTB/POZ-like protein n=1 Tax=Cynara cardunculus var. scolymus TaxID=59895 RepID=A0A103YM35_CYNCS|nr:BTB/POZ-like protein [Cynara cardunculus var. scolymus]